MTGYLSNFTCGAKTMDDLAIKIHHLNKSYGPVIAVDDLSFEVARAECFGLLGPNGAGKSTAMKIIYGKALPNPGPGTTIDILGYNPLIDPLTIKAFSGIVPQEDNLDSELNVTDNLLIYARFYGIKGTVAQGKIKELLDFMELEDKAKVKIRHLSGGMKRRLTIARALLNDPLLLILDEPTTGLDPQVRHLIWNKLRDLKARGVTVLLSTHYMEEAFQICDRIIIMDGGRKLLGGTPHQLLMDNIEEHVMEVYSPDCQQLDRHVWTKWPNLRHESFQDTTFIYSDNAEDLTRLADSLPITAYHIRQSNLEDLFLKVTGRGLNEVQ